MIKKVIAATIMLCMLTTLAGCNFLQKILPTAAGSTSSVASGAEDYIAYALGETVKTYFFDFTVVSAQFVTEYAGIAPEEDNMFVDVVIKTTNTFNEGIPMFGSDYQFQWDIGAGKVDFDYCKSPADDTMVPEEFTLPQGETMEYHYIFEIPAGMSHFSICYLEEFSDDSTGDTYFVEFSL